MWTDARDANLLDGGAHFYGTYACSDGKWIPIGSIVPQFYVPLAETAGLTEPDSQAQMDRARLTSLKAKLIAVIKP